MTSAIQKVRDSPNSTGTVIPFPSQGPAHDLTESSYFVFPQLEGLREEIKRTIEAVVTEAFYRAELGRSLPTDDPFDPVYISLLRPDSVSAEDLDRLSQFAHVVDRSSLLSFDDGWDD